MDIDADPFLKYLVHRSKNLNKKIDKIKQKKIQVRESEVSLQEEEKKLLSSRPTIDIQLKEIEAIQASYIDHIKSIKPVAKEQPSERESKELVALWVLYEFLQNRELLESLDLRSREMAESLLEMGNAVKGKPGTPFEHTKVQAALMVEMFLSASNSLTNDRSHTYAELNEFSKSICENLQLAARPATPDLKPGLALEVGDRVVGNWKEEEVVDEDLWDCLLYTSDAADE